MKKVFLLGVVTGLTIAGASAVFANSHIQAMLNTQIKVTLNGQVQEFKDETTNEIQYPITFKNRTYLPLRTVANLVGVDVDYDENTNTAILTNNKAEMSNNDILKKLEYDYIIDELKPVNDDIEGGFSIIYNAILVNSNKKEMYTIEYSDVWKVHEDRGYKDDVSIEIQKMSDEELLEITGKYKIQENSNIYDLLTQQLTTEYDLKIVNLKD